MLNMKSRLVYLSLPPSLVSSLCLEIGSYSLKVGLLRNTQHMAADV